MGKSTRKSRKSKPAKPNKSFPLFAHQNGQWAKKVRGKLYYFGPWADPQAALKNWEAEQNSILLHGEKREADSQDKLTLKHLADAFLTAKRRRVDNGERSAHTYRDYVVICQFIANHFGKDRIVDSIRPNDFAGLRAAFAKVHGAHRLAKDVRVTRMLFKYGTDNDLIQHVVKFGSEFSEPDRKSKLKAARSHGKKHFEADEARKIVDATDGQLKAMILLGLNGGLGNTDCSEILQSDINLDTGWLEFPRVKTVEDRRIPLWPETVAALHEAISKRPNAKIAADDNCVFLTKYGRQWVRLNADDDPAKRTRADAIAQEFRKLMKSIDLNGRRGFYSLRHTFATAAGDARDQTAINAIMGHADQTMASNYRHHISDTRLQDVVTVVRAWLWPDK